MAILGVRPKYVTDAQGRRVVQLSEAQWKKLERREARRLFIEELKESIRNGLAYIKEVEAGRIKPKSLQEFLDELPDSPDA